METEKLDKVLSDIYSDLKNFQSAKQQVVIVTKSSEELTIAIANLLKELQEFSKNLEINYSSNISQLTKSLNDFENKFNKILEKGNNTIEEFKKTTDDIKKNADEKIEELKTVAIRKIEIQEQIISKTIKNIEDTNSKNNELIAIITKYDIPKRLEDIDKKLVIQFNQNKLIKKLIVVVLSLIGLGSLVAIGLIVKIL